MFLYSSGWHWCKSAQGRHRLLLYYHGLSYPTQTPQGLCAILEQWRWWHDSYSTPFSSWHLTYWCRGSQLEQTQCAVSQLQCRCLWAPGVQSREQVTMSQRLFNSYTYTAKLRGLFSSCFCFSFPLYSPLRSNSLTMLPSILWKSFLLQFCKDLRKGELECTKTLKNLISCTTTIRLTPVNQAVIHSH